MLRSYARVGLLVPAAVDPHSGYRYYDVNQLDEARAVAWLRRAGVPVAEVRSFVGSPSSERLSEWESEFEHQSRQRQEALAQARRQLGFGLKELETTIGGKKMTTFSAAGATNKGRVRESNQDALLVGEALFAVADGMGDNGEEASALAIESLSAALATTLTRDRLMVACGEANRALLNGASMKSGPGREGQARMATTLTALAGPVADGQLVAASIGDSRLYRSRQGQLLQLSTDHSMVAELVQAGQLTEDQARRHPQRMVLTQALGVGPGLSPDVVSIAPEPGDRYLLCTDGLFNDVPETEIEAALATEAPPPDVADRLVALAESHGGNDNVSVVVVDV